MNNHIYSTLYKRLERKSDRSKKPEQRKNHKTDTDTHTHTQNIYIKNQDVAFVALKGSYHCLSTWHLRHRAAAEAGAGLTRVMVDEDSETVGI